MIQFQKPIRLLSFSTDGPTLPPPPQKNKVDDNNNKEKAREREPIKMAEYH